MSDCKSALAPACAIALAALQHWMPPAVLCTVINGLQMHTQGIQLLLQLPD